MYKEGVIMKFIIEKERIYLNNDQGEMIAEARIPFIQTGVFNVERVFVDSSLRGQGMASKVMDEVYNYAKNNNYTVVNSCPYAVAWFKKNTDKQDVLNNEIEVNEACKLV